MLQELQLYQFDIKHSRWSHRKLSDHILEIFPDFDEEGLSSINNLQIEHVICKFGKVSRRIMRKVLIMAHAKKASMEHQLLQYLLTGRLYSPRAERRPESTHHGISMNLQTRLEGIRRIYDHKCSRRTQVSG